MSEPAPFITYYKAVGGWQTVHLVWNAEDGGFYEPWSTGFGPYDNELDAENEAIDWAANEDVEYRPPVKPDVT